MRRICPYTLRGWRLAVNQLLTAKKCYACFFANETSSGESSDGGEDFQPYVGTIVQSSDEDSDSSGVATDIAYKITTSDMITAANGTSTSVPDVLPPPPVSSKLDRGSRIDPWQSSEDSEKDNTYTDPTIA